MNKQQKEIAKAMSRFAKVGIALDRNNYLQQIHIKRPDVVNNFPQIQNESFRSSHSEVFCLKVVLKICNKFTGEHPCRSAILIKLQSNFIEIALRYGCSPVNLLHIFRTPFPKNTSEWLLLKFHQRFITGTPP